MISPSPNFEEICTRHTTKRLEEGATYCPYTTKNVLHTSGDALRSVHQGHACSKNKHEDQVRDARTTVDEDVANHRSAPAYHAFPFDWDGMKWRKFPVLGFPGSGS